MTLQQAGDSGQKDRILRLPGDSGYPPVVLWTDTRAAPHKLAKGRKIQASETPACQPGNSGQEFSCNKKTLPFLHFLVNDARGRKRQLSCNT